MSADPFSPFIGMTLQATGNNNNDWGTILNGSLATIERAIRGNIVRAVTGGTLDLSANPPPSSVSQVLDFVQIFEGALTVNQIVILPNLSGYWKFVNETTGAFQLLLQTPSGTFVNIPQGCSRGVTCDGAGNLLRDDRDTVGHFEYSAVVDPGFLQCSGQSLLKSDYPDLYAKIGAIFGSADSLHFTLPLLTDTGRFLRSTTSTLTVGTSQANQNLAHTHTQATGTITGTTDSQGAHVHTASSVDSGHAHGYTAPPSPAAGQTPGGSFPAVVSGGGSSTTGSGAANITTTIASAGAHTHNVSGSATITLNTQGGTEARPEALAVIISIRY